MNINFGHLLIDNIYKQRDSKKQSICAAQNNYYL